MKAAPITLAALTKKIKGLLKEGLDSHWVVAEISELSVNYSGHCYLDLIQKSDTSEQLIARARGVIWANTFRMLQPYFETTTGQSFTEGIKVMLRVVVEFHEVYGLSLNVVDIEPTYTVGELAIRKRKILEKLNEEGVIDMNKELELPTLTNRIAIISSKTAAGLGDFMNQLHANTSGFKYYTKLFPAIMQGNEAETSIINQLENIFDYAHLFDAVVIIRGGGASTDLECFNNYWLAYNIAQFPIPVLSGIGHEQDYTVVDEVAHTRLKTPTAVAEFLIDRCSVLENNIFAIQNDIIGLSRDILYANKQKLSKAALLFQKHVNSFVRNENKKLSQLNISYLSTVKNKLFKQHRMLNAASRAMLSNSKKLIDNQSHKLELHSLNLSGLTKQVLSQNAFRLEKIDQALQYNKPENILKKGYSITLKNGKSIKDSTTLKKGDVIETLFEKGTKTSTINE